MGSLNLFDQNENDGYNLLFEECTTSTRATDDEQNWPQLETVLIDPYFFHSSTTSYLPIDHGPLYVDTIDGSDSLIHGSWGSYGETEEWDTFASGPSDLGAYCFDNTPESVSAPISDGLHKCPFQSCQRSFDRHCEAKFVLDNSFMLVNDSPMLESMRGLTSANRSAHIFAIIAKRGSYMQKT